LNPIRIDAWTIALSIRAKHAQIARDSPTMQKPSKAQVHYHLPEHCCANCYDSYFSSYNTPMCSRLNGFEMEVEFGGVCDMWRKDALDTENHNEKV
jgi:hypothetical protein